MWGFFDCLNDAVNLCSTLGFSSAVMSVTALVHNSVLAVMKTAVVVKILKILQFTFSIYFFGTAYVIIASPSAVAYIVYLFIYLSVCLFIYFLSWQFLLAF